MLIDLSKYETFLKMVQVIEKWQNFKVIFESFLFIHFFSLYQKIWSRKINKLMIQKYLVLIFMIKIRKTFFAQNS